MSTNLHRFRIASVGRDWRVRWVFDWRKERRIQRFWCHRLCHFIAQDEQIRCQFHTFCLLFDLIKGYTIEQKLTALSLIMLYLTPHIADLMPIELTTILIENINQHLQTLAMHIRYVVNGIAENFLVVNQHENEHSIGAHFERDYLAFRVNVNSISDLMIELLSLLLKRFGYQSQCNKIEVTPQLLAILVYCYRDNEHNQMVIERNLHTIHTMTEGVGRLQRTKAIADHQPLMNHILNYRTNETESVIVLKIVNNISKHYPENIEHLLQINLLTHLKRHLEITNWSLHVIEQWLCILENICGNHRSHIAAVIDAGFISPIICVFKNHASLRDNALNIFCSIAKLGNTDHLKVLLQFDLMHLLCAQLRNHSLIKEDYVQTVLDLIKTIVNDLYRNDQQTYMQVSRAVLQQMDVINAYTRHDNRAISSMATELIMCLSKDSRLSNGHGFPF